MKTAQSKPLGEANRTAEKPYVFKARPIDKRVLESAGQLGVPRVEKRQTTKVQEFQLSSSMTPRSAKVAAPESPLYSSFGSLPPAPTPRSRPPSARTPAVAKPSSAAGDTAPPSASKIRPTSARATKSTNATKPRYVPTEEVWVEAYEEKAWREAHEEKAWREAHEEKAWREAHEGQPDKETAWHEALQEKASRDATAAAPATAVPIAKTSPSTFSTAVLHSAINTLCTERPNLSNKALLTALQELHADWPLDSKQVREARRAIQVQGKPPPVTPDVRSELKQAEEPCTIEIAAPSTPEVRIKVDELQTPPTHEI